MNPKILFTIMAACAGLFFLKSGSKKPSKKTRRIVILGLKAAGKTTLWNALRGRLNVIPESTLVENIEKFTIKDGDRCVEIAATKDIGGGKDQVRHYYDELIKDGTFIYFLVDINSISKNKDDIKARLYKMRDVLKGGNGGTKKSDCGYQILATHKDTFLKNQVKGKSDAEMIEYVIDRLDLTSDGEATDILERIKPIDLLSSQGVQEIKNDILNG
jgi:hypothetical protein